MVLFLYEETGNRGRREMYINIYGMPGGPDDDQLQKFLNEIMEAMVKTARVVTGIEYHENQVKVWFPGDRMEKGLGKEWTIEVACLGSPANAPRDERESNVTAEVFTNTLQSFFPDFWDIECEVRPFRRNEGGYNSRNQDPNVFRLIPKDKNYPIYAVQCDGCGGYGCEVCDDKGWLDSRDHQRGRRCRHDSCRRPLHPCQLAVYCSNRCAYNDA